MRRMFLETQAIQYQRIETAHLVQRRRRNLAEVGCVSKIVEPVRHHRQAAMDYFQRRNQQVLLQTKRRAGLDRMRDNLWQAAAKMRGLEDVPENAADIDPGA